MLLRPGIGFAVLHHVRPVPHASRAG